MDELNRKRHCLSLVNLLRRSSRVFCLWHTYSCTPLCSYHPPKSIDTRTNFAKHPCHHSTLLYRPSQTTFRLLSRRRRCSLPSLSLSLSLLCRTSLLTWPYLCTLEIQLFSFVRLLVCSFMDIIGLSQHVLSRTENNLPHASNSSKPNLDHLQFLIQKEFLVSSRQYFCRSANPSSLSTQPNVTLHRY